MPSSRAMRLAGYALVVVLGEPLWIQSVCFDSLFIRSARFALWCAAYATFAIAFHVSVSAGERARQRRLAALGVMFTAACGMLATQACEFGVLALVLLAWQGALVLPLRALVAFAVAQTAVLGVPIVSTWGFMRGLSHMLGLVVAEAFAIAAVRAADRATRMARELVRANAELRATRDLLDQAARAHERTRISRELHDVLGHDLTALGLQLEIAASVPGDRAAPYLAMASEVNARLLRDVRGVVDAMRGEVADLGAALRTLAEGVPGLVVHLDMPEALHVGDPARGHCLLRCVQEIITNALRHSHASNLWIAIATAGDAGAMQIDARDDGRGVRELRAGLGLTGMRARLEEMGGWLRVDGEPSAFAVSAWLPGAEAA